MTYREACRAQGALRRLGSSIRRRRPELLNDDFIVQYVPSDDPIYAVLEYDELRREMKLNHELNPYDLFPEF